MLTLLIVLLSAATLVLTVVRPKWGTGLIWLILFTYPHTWWFNHPILPLNIGVDDLLCVVLFVVVVIRRNLFAGIRVRRGYAFWTTTAFVLVATIANLSGAMEAPFERVLYVKDILKLCVVWGLFYAVLHCIDDADDLRRQLTMFSIAAAAGGVLVVLHHVLPGRMQDWSNPSFLEIQEVTGRASGAFLNPNGAACVLACSLVLVVTAIQLQGFWPSKGLLGLSCVVLLLGVSVTQSRSGFAALAGTFGLMALIGRTRRIAWAILACAFLVVTFAGVRQALEARMATVYDPGSGTWDRNLAGRAESWQRYFETATPKVVLLGQGQRGGITRNGSESHSAYVSTLTVYGVGGLVWAIVSLVGFWRKARTGPEDEDARTALVKSGCLWAFCAWAIYAATSDAISSQYPRYLLFYLVVLVDRASAVAQETALVHAYWDQIMDNAVKPIDAVARVSAES